MPLYATLGTGLSSCWVEKIVGRNVFRLDEATWQHLKDFGNFLDWIGQHNLDTCNIHYRLQSSLIDLASVDFVGRFEHIDKGYREVCRLLAVPMSGIEHLNRSKRTRSAGPGKSGHYRDFYTPAQAEQVRQLYCRDIQIFGYQY